MAKERGWWKIEFTTKPDTVDLEHISQLIEQGYTEGEINETEHHCTDPNCPSGNCEIE